VTDQTPETDAGRQAAADKKAAAEEIRRRAAEDQAAAAEAEKRREQTAAARAASKARAEQRRAAEAGQLPAVDAEPAAVQGCEECRQSQEIIFERLGRLETQVQAIGKLVATGIVAGVVIWYLAGREKSAARAELAAAEPAE
jgi:hypothetical protein